MDTVKELARPAWARAIPARVAARAEVTIAGPSKGRNPRFPSAETPAGSWGRISALSKGANSTLPTTLLLPTYRTRTTQILSAKARSVEPTWIIRAASGTRLRAEAAPDRVLRFSLPTKCSAFVPQAQRS